jgi:hypothetical protein
VRLTSVPLLDRQRVALEDHRHAMEGVAVPGHRLAGCEAQAADEDRSALDEPLFAHDRSKTPPERGFSKLRG